MGALDPNLAVDPGLFGRKTQIGSLLDGSVQPGGVVPRSSLRPGRGGEARSAA
jgi:hypothetical protein